MQKKLNQRGFGIVPILLIVLILAVVGFAGWYVFNSQQDEKQDIATVKKEDNSKPTITPTSVPTSLPSNVVDWQTAKAGEQYGGMTIASIGARNYDFSDKAENNLKVVYAGQAELAGTYKYYEEISIGFGWLLLFTPTENINNSFPHIKGLNNDRSFAIAITDESLSAFGLTEGQEKTGTARIVINSYTYISYPSEGINEATLQSVKKVD